MMRHSQRGQELTAKLSQILLNTLHLCLGLGPRQLDKCAWDVFGVDAVLTLDSKAWDEVPHLLTLVPMHHGEDPENCMGVQRQGCCAGSRLAHMG